MPENDNFELIKVLVKNQAAIGNLLTELVAANKALALRVTTLESSALRGEYIATRL